MCCEGIIIVFEEEMQLDVVEGVSCVIVFFPEKKYVKEKHNCVYYKGVYRQLVV